MTGTAIRAKETAREIKVKLRNVPHRDAMSKKSKKGSKKKRRRKRRKDERERESSDFVINVWLKGRIRGRWIEERRERCPF